MHCDSYIKVLVIPRAQTVFDHQRVNTKMVESPDCGKEFTRKFNMERHRAINHSDAFSEDGSSVTEEYSDRSDHDTESSDENDSSVEQKSTVNEGNNDDDDDSDDEEDEDDGDDSSSGSQSTESSTDEDEDDSVWSGIRDLSWTTELVDTFDDKQAELVEGGMLASDAHQAAYRCILPNLRRNITTNYMKKIMEKSKLRQDPIHRKTLTTK